MVDWANVVKILHIYKDFEPTNGGGGVARHIEGLCTYLAANNCVTVSAFVCEPRRDSIRTELLTYSRLPALIRDADVVHIHGARMLCAFASGVVAALIRKPFFYTPHCYYDSNKFLKKLVKGIWDNVAERFLLRFSYATFFLADDWIDYVRRHAGNASLAAVVPNCIDAGALKIAQRQVGGEALAGTPSILYVGRLDPVKCLDHVMAAMGHPVLATATLHVVGKGADRQRLERLARESGIDCRVVFYGFQDDDAVMQLASLAHVFVLPSAKEGLPTALLEMLLRRLPAVASDIPGNMAVLDPLGLNYCSYRFGDVDALALKLAEIASRTIIDEAVIARLHGLFTWEAQAKKIEDHYRAALA
jgi:glycosyltransferase involved in cell wall biosynthesis